VELTAVCCVRVTILYCSCSSSSSSSNNNNNSSSNSSNSSRAPELANQEQQQQQQQQQQKQQQQQANGGKYSHFGSELVLVQSGVCMECARQGKKRIKRTATTVYSVTDDTAGITKDDLYFAQDPSAADDFCAHSMREGSSYFKGREHPTGLFDSLAMRVSVRHLRHRMHLYEDAIRSRFEQTGTTNGANSSTSSSNSSSNIISTNSSSSSSSSGSSSSSNGSNSDRSSVSTTVDREAAPSESAAASPTVAVNNSTK
jgi:hypothetical protein